MSDKNDRAGKLVFRLNDHGQGPELLRQVFLERGWMEFDEDSQEEEDWNLWWRTSRFRNSDYDLLRSYQQINHYPRSTAITKKDSLARNLKRMRGVYGSSVYNFSPIAFNLPNDYTKFVAEYTRLKEKDNSKDLCWICKPADLSRGRGIFIFRDLSELQYDCSAVIQQYLTNPMLISGYKFDLRIYVMVPSFHPLNIYIYREGLVRFGTEKFNMNNLQNLYSHLTNTSINKYSPSYTADKERVGPGCKWTITQLRHYFRQCNIDDNLLWRKIVDIVVLTLILQANQVPKVTNCFELYGFDIIIDDQRKVWLLEVNFSPALSSDCPTDLMVKKPMLHDLLDFLNFQKKDKLRGNIDKASHKRPHKLLSRAGRRLPHITGSFNSLMTSPHEESAEEEQDSDSDNDGVVPVIPGCGLPSVQQPAAPSWRSGGGNSSHGSSASSWKSTDGAESHAGSNRRGSSTQTHQSLKRTDSKSNHHATATSPETTKEPHHSSLQSKNTSKVSMQSDSGVSSYSGSSDNTDLNALPDNVQAKLNGSTLTKSILTNGKRHFSHQIDLQDGGRLLRGGSNSMLQSRPSKMPVVSTSLNTMPSTGLLNRYAFTDLVPDELKPTQISHAASARLPSSSTRPTLPRNTRASDLRTLVHTNTNKKKLGQFGYTVNPLLAKSSLLSRRGSLSQMFNASKLVSNYSKPWQNRGNSCTSESTPKSTTRVPQNRVGDFYLVYPFNEATRKCSAGTQDVKIVVRESQKLLKEFQATKMLKTPLFDILMLWEAHNTDS